jgi:hypothetical protein
VITAIVMTVVALAAIGLAVSLSIVRREGIEGLWNRKKDWIEKTQPGLAPSVDKAEKAVRSHGGP